MSPSWAWASLSQCQCLGPEFQPASALRDTYWATERQEELKERVLGEGRVPGHQVDEALQGPPAALDKLPVGWRRAQLPQGRQRPQSEQASR